MIQNRAFPLSMALILLLLPASGTSGDGQVFTHSDGVSSVTLESLDIDFRKCTSIDSQLFGMAITFSILADLGEGTNASITILYSPAFDDLVWNL